MIGVDREIVNVRSSLIYHVKTVLQLHTLYLNTFDLEIKNVFGHNSMILTSSRLYFTRVTQCVRFNPRCIYVILKITQPTKRISMFDSMSIVCCQYVNLIDNTF